MNWGKLYVLTLIFLWLLCYIKTMGIHQIQGIEKVVTIASEFITNYWNLKYA